MAYLEQERLSVLDILLGHFFRTGQTVLKIGILILFDLETRTIDSS